jgi:hypothetical protein
MVTARRTVAWCRCLAELNLADQRFGKNYEDMAPGLAR